MTDVIPACRQCHSLSRCIHRPRPRHSRQLLHSSNTRERRIMYNYCHIQHYWITGAAVW